MLALCRVPISPFASLASAKSPSAAPGRPAADFKYASARARRSPSGTRNRRARRGVLPLAPRPWFRPVPRRPARAHDDDVGARQPSRDETTNGEVFLCDYETRGDDDSPRILGVDETILVELGGAIPSQVALESAGLNLAKCIRKSLSSPRVIPQRR